MAIDNKTDLIKEIEAFSKTLYEHGEIGSEMIPHSKFKPYYSELGILKREDYSEDILDEEAFLVFYSLFFDKIRLNPNAEQVSDSKYFNTLYQNYRDKQKSAIADLDLFMQVIETSKEKEVMSRNKNNKEEHNAIELFLQNIFINKIHKEIKSKTSSNQSLFNSVRKAQSNREDRLATIVISFLLLIPCGLITILQEFGVLSQIFLAAFFLLIIFYCFIYFLSYKITKQEKEEIKQLPKNFKDFLLYQKLSFDKEFFNDKITSYLDLLLKDSDIYKYVKEKYNKKESENSIINE